MNKLKITKMISNMKKFKACSIKYQLSGIHSLKLKRKAILRIIFLLKKLAEVLTAQYAKLK